MIVRILRLHFLHYLLLVLGHTPNPEGCELSRLESVKNLPECIPTNTTGQPLYFSSSCARTGSVCMQLMQHQVQKSKTTTFPLSFEKFNGSSVLIHSKFSGKSGAFASGGKNPPNMFYHKNSKIKIVHS